MFLRLGTLVERYWAWILLTWLVLAIGLRAMAPAWDDITYDGDLAYLPDDRPSVVGEALLEDAFPLHRAKSQIVLIVARDDEPLRESDILGVAFDLARRVKLLHALAAFERAQQLAGSRLEPPAEGEADDARPEAPQRAAEQLLADAEAAFNDALYFDEGWTSYWQDESATGEVATGESASGDLDTLAPRIYLERSRFYEFVGDDSAALDDRKRAQSFEVSGEPPTPLDQIIRGATAVEPNDALRTQLAPILDVWTWSDEIFGDTLISQDESAALILLQLNTEFLATENIPLLKILKQQLADARASAERQGLTGLSIGMTGSAAVGADMLSSAAESIRHTELFTIILVVLILAVVYRAPLLVLVPLVSIAVSLVVSTSLVALLTQLSLVPGFGWWELKVFTTTKIFIVVILFGAGTDYCLFLIARYKEELAADGSTRHGVARALGGVGEALAASALTTIVGLGTMFFAEFGKFRYSGPIIGLCLLVTLLTCITLTPALLRAMGPAVFWPFWSRDLRRRETRRQEESSGTSPSRPRSLHDWGQRFWSLVAAAVVRYPGSILAGCLLLMLPAVLVGIPASGHVTYDLLNAIDQQRPSRQGAEILKEHFPVGEGGPLVVLAHNPKAEFQTRDGREQIKNLTESLYEVEGVRSVRSLTDPLGEFLPGETRSFFDRRSWDAWVRQPHRRTAQIFLSQSRELDGDVARFDVILDHDPFSIEATRTLEQVESQLTRFAESREDWQQTRFSFAGTTAGIRDLREVTQSDNLRIEVLVVIAVFLVLLCILRRPVICLYMIGSVLLSYYFTMGLTEWFFQWVYQDSYAGLDWKVPLFLFVILVAVGQDYNVYLATRVFEEQAKHGSQEGLRLAIIRTGGIITSCGLIMAGTFLSMTSGAWVAWLPADLPVIGSWFESEGALRGIVELGFALALGVTLDTIVVRPILLPAFLALWGDSPKTRAES